LANRLLRHDHAPKLTVRLPQSNLELQIALLKALQAFIQAPGNPHSFAAQGSNLAPQLIEQIIRTGSTGRHQRE
jgi:hypothetical protein